MPTPKEGYYTADGTRVPGVTTVLGLLAKPALIPWAYKRGKDGLELYESRDKAADIGTLAHAMCEAHLLGKAPAAVLEGQPVELAAQAEVAYAAFVQWLGQTRAEVVSVEQPFVSEAHRYGGTPDIVLRIDGKLAMGDLKTSNALYREAAIQIAAYALLWNETHEEQITGGFHLLRLGKDAPDFEHRYFGDLDDARELWLHLLAAYRLDQQLKKRIK